MQQQTVVGLYKSRDEASDVRNRLISEGVPEGAIALRAQDDGAADTELTTRSDHERGGFWEWLFGSDDDEAGDYRAHLHGERTAVAVAVTSPETHRRVIEIMEMYDPVDVGDEGAAASGSGIAATGSSGLAAGVDPAAPDTTPIRDTTGGLGTTGVESDLGTAHIENSQAATASSAEGTPARSSEDGDQVIPVTREALDVGKRAAERRYRIRSYVVEHPVEEQVELRDERVVIERRPAQGFRRVSPESFQEREFEVVERHEEPVVSKRAEVAEEVVVHRDVQQRVETVRDTVREGRVEVEDGSAPGRTDAPDATPGNRVRHTE